jgi:hypothetical protein
MQLQKRPTEAIEFTLKEHESIEPKPSFTLKPLSVSKFDECGNLFASARGVSAVRLACHYGIKGWANIEPEFSSDKATQLIDDYLSPEQIVEIGSKIIDISAVSEKEKN